MAVQNKNVAKPPTLSRSKKWRDRYVVVMINILIIPYPHFSNLETVRKKDRKRKQRKREEKARMKQLADPPRPTK
jgi:hypothetical protein